MAKEEGGLCSCFFFLVSSGRSRTHPRPLSSAAEDEAISITRQICEAMAYTHRKGVTHRDLKPEVSLLRLRSELDEIAVADGHHFVSRPSRTFSSPPTSRGWSRSQISGSRRCAITAEPSELIDLPSPPCLVDSRTDPIPRFSSTASSRWLELLSTVSHLILARASPTTKD